MDARTIERLISEELPDAEVTVSTRSDLPEDDHFEALVVSSAFADKSLVQQHELVYDALGEHMTQEIHALELTTYTPAEYHALDRE